MSEITQMDVIKTNIEYGAKGTTNKEITQNILKEWRGSQKIKDMQDAEKYFLVQNTEIDKKTRDYKDNDGNIVSASNNLSNTKTKTSKYRKAINEKSNFALNKPFTISCDDDKYKEQWDLFLNKAMRKVISRIGKNAINKGIAWAYPWINKEGNLEIIDTPAETIYPAWSDIAHTKLDAVVRDYITKEYMNETPTEVHKVEFWDNKIYQKFIDYGKGEGNGDLVDDNDLTEDSELAKRTSVIYTHMTNRSGKGISWDRVPFIAFKGNDDELPALNECRSDIDNYDLVKSKGIDSILDDIDAVLVVKNISAEINDLLVARKIVQNSRIISVDSDGDAHFEKVGIDIQAIRDELDIIKKDMINDTNTVDVTTINFGSNPSGKAMRMFFEPLNIWCNGFEEEFNVFMANLKYFFDKWLGWKGGFGSFEELQKKEITFELDRDLIIDETDIINNIMQLHDELSQETRDELNPYVEDHEKEEKRREEDKEKEQDELAKMQKEIGNTNLNDEDEEKQPANIQKEDKEKQNKEGSKIL